MTNTCAAVTLTPGSVYELGTATSAVTYENGGADVTLTFDAFGQDISYCPVIYTVHLLDMGDNEVTWNREDNPLTHTPAYTAIPDSTFSSNAPSSEYLTISRPDGGAGSITISNTGALTDFVGSYKLQLRAHHQGVTQ